MGEDSEEINEDIQPGNVGDKEATEFYLNAEKARLIYHSVHDTSILFLLEALGISNGRQPMFAGKGGNTFTVSMLLLNY